MDSFLAELQPFLNQLLVAHKPVTLLELRPSSFQRGASGFNSPRTITTDKNCKNVKGDVKVEKACALPNVHQEPPPIQARFEQGFRDSG